MTRQTRVMGALMSGGPTWTIPEVREQLAAQGLAPQHLVRLTVSTADRDPAALRALEPSASDEGRERSFLARVGRGLIKAVLLVLALLLSDGSIVGGSWPKMFVGPVRDGSEAEIFVRALLNATSELRGVRQRWLAFSSPSDAVLVTQETYWDITGAHTILEMRWESGGERLNAISVRKAPFRRGAHLEFGDGSAVRLELRRRAFRSLAGALAGD